MANQLVRSKAVKPAGIDLQKIFQKESSFVSDAHNTRTDARGLGQITPVGLADWNQRNPQDQHQPDDLYRSDVNAKISNWTLNQRIPQMLQVYGIQDTPENRLIAYHDGIGNLHSYIQGKRKLGPEMTNYLQAYKTIQVQGQPQ